jgi:ABC-type dipeptide/oligopeptide/nickel transport system permease subunit
VLPARGFASPPARPVIFPQAANMFGVPWLNVVGDGLRDSLDLRAKVRLGH